DDRYRSDTEDKSRLEPMSALDQRLALNKAVPFVFAALWPPPSTTRGRRQSGEMPHQALARLRRSDPLRPITPFQWALRRSCLKLLPFPSRKGGHARGRGVAPRTVPRPNS